MIGPSLSPPPRPSVSPRHLPNGHPVVGIDPSQLFSGNNYGMFRMKLNAMICQELGVSYDDIKQISLKTENKMSLVNFFADLATLEPPIDKDRLQEIYQLARAVRQSTSKHQARELYNSFKRETLSFEAPLGRQCMVSLPFYKEDSKNALGAYIQIEKAYQENASWRAGIRQDVELLVSDWHRSRLLKALNNADSGKSDSLFSMHAHIDSSRRVFEPHIPVTPSAGFDHSLLGEDEDVGAGLPPFPKRSEAQAVIFHGIDEHFFDGRDPISYNLGDLRTHVSEEDDGEGKVTYGAISATMVVSGKEGKSVPVSLAGGTQFGLVFSPEKVNVPHADFVGYHSHGQISEKEEQKAGFKYYDYVGDKQLDSKYSEKRGTPRFNDRGDFIDFAANYAKYDGATKKTSKEASLGIMMKNLWRRYHQEPKKYDDGHVQEGRHGGKGVMTHNELMVFQKGDENPVEGLFIDVSNGNLNDDQVRIVLDALKKNPHLKLYVYDRNQKDHIVRVCSSNDGGALLEKGIDYVNSRTYVPGLNTLVHDRTFGK